MQGKGEARRDCVVFGDRGDVESLAVVEYTIDEAFWGVEGATVIVERVPGNVPSCIALK